MIDAFHDQIIIIDLIDLHTTNYPSIFFNCLVFPFHLQDCSFFYSSGTYPPRMFNYGKKMMMRCCLIVMKIEH